MKILQVIKPLGMGGVERIVCSLNSEILNRKEESYIMINKSQYEQFISHFNIEYTENIIKYDDSSMLKMLIDMQKKIKQINPDIIQTHARKECVLVSLLNKKIVHIRTQHMGENPKLKVTSFEKRLLSNRVSAWISTSDYLKKEYLLQREYIDPKKIFVVYNGVEQKEKEKMDFDVNNQYCIISRLTIQKGIDILIEKIKEINEDDLNFHIDIYGEGEELDSILQLIKKYNLSNVIKYIGKTNNPSAIAKKYDALLMPSRYEGLPLTMLESMSVGTPVAIHDVGCVREIIKNGENGWIVDDSFSWNDFFKKSNQNYESICHNALNIYKTKFSEENMVNSYMDVYEKHLKK